ncbi:MAG: class I SAM-dependent methyltransferase [Proteobacteria bacterium]|nr:class I SAM-dependent methyltransferase [Pseudomonadota bacterium]
MTRPETNATNPKDQWESHWERFADSTRANPAQILRRRLIARLLGDVGPDARILDLGCGSGDLLAALAETFPQAAFAGADQSQSGLGRTRQELPGAKLFQFDFSHPDTAPEELRGWASHVVCSEVLEHLDDPTPALDAAARCLKPGGRLVVTVPGGPMTAFDRHIGHRRHFTKARLIETLEGAGWRVETAAAAGFPVFNLYRLVVLMRGRRLIDDVSGRPGPLARGVMALFRSLMPLALFDSPGGWQIAASALRPD